jgi:hypothetical protein
VKSIPKSNFIYYLYHNPFNLLVLTLTLVTFIKVAIIGIIHPVFYNFDETIITQISKLPLANFFNTVAAEPNPFGFYFLLRYFPVNDIFLSKIILTLLTSTIFLLGLYLERKVIKDTNLIYGILIFLISYGVIDMLSILKQDSLSIPIFTIAFLESIKILKYEKYSYTSYIFLNILTIFLLLLSTIHYLEILGIILLITFSKKSKQIIINFLIPQAITYVIFFFFYGFTEYLLVFERLGKFAITMFPNSAVSSLSQFMLGVQPGNIVNDILIVFILFNIYTFLTFKNKQITEKFILLITLLFFIIFSGFNLFTEVRYSVSFYLLICLIIGWVLKKYSSEIKRYNTELIISLSLILITLGNLFIWARSLYISELSSKHLQKTINSFSTPIGFISDNELNTFTYTYQYKLAYNIIPFIPHLKTIQSEANIITRNYLVPENQNSSVSNNKLEEHFHLLGVDSYLYLMIMNNNVDNAKRIYLPILMSKCSKVETLETWNRMLLLKFTECEI